MKNIKEFYFSIFIIMNIGNQKDLKMLLNNENRLIFDR